MVEPLPLYEGAVPCVGSGFCCKQTPCAFGEVKSDTDNSCKYLEEVPQKTGKHSRYTCGKYEEIIGRPGWEFSPAFGAGCCSPMGNEDRQEILKDLRIEMRKHWQQ